MGDDGLGELISANNNGYISILANNNGYISVDSQINGDPGLRASGLNDDV